MQPDRAVFDVTKLPAVEFALSLGLPSAPQLRFLKRRAGSIAPHRDEPDERPGYSATVEAAVAAKGVDSEAMAVYGHIVSDANVPEHYDGVNCSRHRLDSPCLPAQEEEDFLTVKHKHVLSADMGEDTTTGPTPDDEILLPGKKKKRKLRIDPGKASGQRVVFDEGGEAQAPLAALALGVEDEG